MGAGLSGARARSKQVLHQVIRSCVVGVLLIWAACSNVSAMLVHASVSVHVHASVSVHASMGTPTMSACTYHHVTRRPTMQHATCLTPQGKSGPPAPKVLPVDSFSKPPDMSLVFDDGTVVPVHRWILELCSHLMQVGVCMWV